MRAELRRLKRDTDSSQHSVVVAADDMKTRLSRLLLQRIVQRQAADCVVKTELSLRRRSPQGRRAFLVEGGHAVLLLLAAIMAGGLYWRSHRAPKLSDQDTLVLADFNNTTGDPVFDDTLKQAISVQLGQSPFLNILSDAKIRATLKLMAKPRGTKLTPEVARDLCQRADAKAYVSRHNREFGQPICYWSGSGQLQDG